MKRSHAAMVAACRLAIAAVLTLTIALKLAAGPAQAETWTGAQAPVQTQIPAQTQSERPLVDLALVLVVDASGSIDPSEFRLQKEGIAAAITDADILGAIRGGGHGRIAVAYVEWGSPGAPANVVPWMLVGDRGSAERFAASVLQAPRSPQSWNAIGDAIHLATGMMETCPCRPTRRIIDLSGDNVDYRSHLPAPLARDAAVAAGITINALAILNDDSRGASGRPFLVEVYEREVIGGFAAFVATAADRGDFARALRQKMVQEISSR
ncbi:DUF1194 domain-containing protein [Dongia soli]|uniref:DUF1194 domain-containing protein n=1 Tax=Dongia soli TaxID=600628 RepID=A0ABU5EHF4_9PROT|nr:DUF1194 domain-containing protein [Dongia soli]MDY0884915.1 DUF1194 domain-containing protein [Dongia soli]